MTTRRFRLRPKFMRFADSGKKQSNMMFRPAFQKRSASNRIDTQPVGNQRVSPFYVETRRLVFARSHTLIGTRIKLRAVDRTRSAGSANARLAGPMAVAMVTLQTLLLAATTHDLQGSHQTVAGPVSDQSRLDESGVNLSQRGWP